MSNISNALIGQCTTVDTPISLRISYISVYLMYLCISHAVYLHVSHATRVVIRNVLHESRATSHVSKNTPTSGGVQKEEDAPNSLLWKLGPGSSFCHLVIYLSVSILVVH